MERRQTTSNIEQTVRDLNRNLHAESEWGVPNSHTYGKGKTYREWKQERREMRERIEQGVNETMHNNCADCDKRASRRQAVKAGVVRVLGGLLYATFHVGATIAVVLTLA